MGAHRVVISCMCCSARFLPTQGWRPYVVHAGQSQGVSGLSILVVVPCCKVSGTRYFCSELRMSLCSAVKVKESERRTWYATSLCHVVATATK